MSRMIVISILFMLSNPAHATMSCTVPLDEQTTVEIIDGKFISLVLANADQATACLLDVTAVAKHYNRKSKNYHLPYEELVPECQKKTFAALFPDDYQQGDMWHHKVCYIGKHLGGENIFRIALWLTGSGRNYQQILKLNPEQERVVKVGDWIKVPLSLVIPAFLSTDEQEETTSETPAETPAPEQPAMKDVAQLEQDNGTCLTYGSDEQGPYALYHLKKGEALYSAVVMRFTGRMTASEVNSLASEIATRSGIKDVTDIPIGYKIKIPLDYLTPEFLPHHDERYQDYVKNRQAIKQYDRKILAHNLDRVKIIIDPGHGGRDPGALGFYGLVEDEIVYDIACRIREVLLMQTKAQVEFTNYDPYQAYAPRSSSSLADDHHEYLLTTPPYKNTNSTVSANLRWYLANSSYKKWLAQNGARDRIVFISLHADALHPSATGSMIYIPAAELRKGKYGHKGDFYQQFREVREQPSLSFSSQDRYQSEAYSLRLATHIMQELKQLNMPIHPRKPVREFIIRHNKTWVPAVLRANAIPTKILVEVANLKNMQDCQNLKSADFRDKIARSITNGIISYFE